MILAPSPKVYAHRYRIERDVFEAICEARGWLVEEIPINGLWYVCQLPPGVRSSIKMGRGYWSVAQTCVGTYSPRITRCFNTNLVPKPDPRVVPWCGCCQVSPPIEHGKGRP